MYVCIYILYTQLTIVEDTNVCVHRGNIFIPTLVWSFFKEKMSLLLYEHINIIICLLVSLTCLLVGMSTHIIYYVLVKGEG